MSAPDETERHPDNRGWRRVLRRESEWSWVEWVALAVVIGLTYFAFGLTREHHDGLGASIIGGGIAVVGMLWGRRIRRRRLQRRASRERAAL